MLGTVRRPIQKLDPGWVKRTPEIGMHADGGGLYLQVSRFGTKSWIFRFMLDGRRREMGLGPFPSLSLAGAREKAADCRNMVRSNRIDPIETRKAQRNQARIAAAKKIKDPPGQAPCSFCSTPRPVTSWLTCDSEKALPLGRSISRS
jgi:hypothetical protein